MIKYFCKVNDKNKEFMFEAVIFDLDGTLTNPISAFKQCLNYILNKMGKENVSDENLIKWVGPPIRESFKNFLNFSNEEVEIAMAYYKEYYGQNGLSGNTIYKGIDKMLKAIFDSGIKIALATSKMQEFANEILKMHHIDKYFSVIKGASSDGKIIEKSAILQLAIKELACDKSKTIMVGDRMHDIIGAEQNGLDCIGVLWGYGSENELKSFGAKKLCKTPKELAEIILRG